MYFKEDIIFNMGIAYIVFLLKKNSKQKNMEKKVLPPSFDRYAL